MDRQFGTILATSVAAASNTRAVAFQILFSRVWVPGLTPQFGKFVL